MRVLVIAPHPDDEVLGVGGTMIKRVLQGHEVHVCVVTRGYPPMFDQKYISQGVRECRLANALLGTSGIYFLRKPASSMDTISLVSVIEPLRNIILELKPDEVYIPHRGDVHNDHKAVVDAAMVALRPKHSHKVCRIYSYECPSETGWDIPAEYNAFIPNVFEDISDTLDLKIQAMEKYKSQIEKYPGARSPEAIRALAVHRGTTVYTAAAEAFSLVREIK